MLQLEILYFAWVRDAIGRDGDRIDHPGAGASISDVVAMLAARDEGYAQAFADRDRLRAALDQQFVPLDALLGDATELALFPPVTGG
ncbi:MAG: MoaD/ThiS family protein [Sphingobium sp.]